MADTCEYGEEPSGSKNAGNFLTSCRTSYILKKDSALWSKKVRVKRTNEKEEIIKCAKPGLTDLSPQ